MTVLYHTIIFTEYNIIHRIIHIQYLLNHTISSTLQFPLLHLQLSPALPLPIQSSFAFRGFSPSFSHYPIANAIPCTFTHYPIANAIPCTFNQYPIANAIPCLSTLSSLSLHFSSIIAQNICNM